MHVCLLYIFSSETSVHVFAHFLIGLFRAFLLLSFWEFFIYFRYESFVGCVVCKYFLPGCNSSFHSLLRVFHRAKVLIWGGKIDQFFHLWIVFLISSLETLHLALGPHDFLLFFLKVLYFTFYIQVHDPFWVNFCVITWVLNVWGLGWGSFRCLWISIVPTPFVEKVILPQLNCFCSFVKNHFDIFVWSFTWHSFCFFFFLEIPLPGRRQPVGSVWSLRDSG